MAPAERCTADVADVLAVDPAALVARARAGDADAWDELYRAAYPKLLAYARRRLAVDEAREAVSEAMARAVARIDRFTWQGLGFDAWLFGILRHVVVDAHRARGRRTRLAAAAVSATVAEGPGPLERLLHDEEAMAVRAAFERLSEAERELLELRVVGGLSAEEVAAVLGKRPGAVRTAQSRALERLRRLLQEAEGGAER